MKEGVRSPLGPEGVPLRSDLVRRRLRERGRERSTSAGSEVLLTDMDDRVDDAVDCLAQRERHSGVRI